MKRFLSLLLSIAFLGSQAQEIVNVDPNEGHQNQQLELTITGQQTNFTQGSNTVWLQQGSNTTIYSSSIQTVSNTQLLATFNFYPYHELGMYAMHVYNSVHGTMILENAFTLNVDPDAPQIVDVTPDQGTQGEFITLEITGQNTHFNQASNTVFLRQGSSTIYSDNTSSQSNNILDADFHLTYDNPPGYYDLYAYNNYDGYLGLNQAFYLNPGQNAPAILSVTPNQGMIGTYISVEIKGINTHFTDPSNEVYLIKNYEGLHVTYENIIDDTTMIVSIGSFDTSPMGWYELIIINDVDGNVYMQNAFEVKDLGPLFPFDLMDLVISEDTENGSIIADNIEVQGNNTDHTFTIVSGNEAEQFYLDPYSCDLFVSENGDLDYETTTMYSLIIRVTDSENNYDETYIEISLENTNDNSPELHETLLQIQENSSNGTEVNSIESSDADGDLTPLKYDLVYQSLDNTFVIDENTGMLSVNDSTLLNFELHTEADIVVSVSDGLHTTNKNFVVEILDINEVGMDEDFDKYFSIYPNPVTDNFIIKKSIEEKAILEIINSNGMLVDRITLTDAEKRINSLSDKAKGVYILRITIGNKQHMKKIVLE